MVSGAGRVLPYLHLMRISIPSLPQTQRLLPTVTDVQEAVEQLYQLLDHNRRVLCITGAGVSVDSGISSYRGPNGLYVNKGYRPVYYHEFMHQGAFGDLKRRRYWARSYLGYPSVRLAQPNATHQVLAALQHTKYLDQLVTQNVDRLHHVATDSIGGDTSSIHELHGLYAGN